MTLSPLVRRILPLLILAAGVIGFLVLRATAPESPPMAVGERVWRVNTETVTPATLAPILSLYGHVTTPRTANLRAAVEADVLETPGEEGRRVEAGQVLVRLDDREIGLLVTQREADVADIRAQISAERLRNARDREALKHDEALLEIAWRNVERAQDLLSRNLGSQSALDEARRAHEQQALAVNARRLALEDFQARLAQLEARARRAEALLEDARLDLERTRVRAPFAGRVSRLSVAPGDRVRIGDPLATLFDADALEVRARIPALYLPVVRRDLDAGEPLVARGEIDGENVLLELSRLAGEAPATGAGVEGLFRIREGGEHAPLGRFLTVHLRLPEQDGVVALPFEALYGTDRVYRVEEGRMRAITVQRRGEWLDDNGRERVLVYSPEIRDGDRLVTTRLPNALDGLRVETDGD
ncbi:efflux RND transporter periplasmic adaptor subunit [Thioalkalivibrio sulfidiphilus]|uniref:efflux RND transporter periplasmic adaptor subunit n=1 Tax=Thioalkalivibrio sulfidiphilus TaxID=1033854 RepID=UPI0003736B1E|nr:HlyD family efflux transporter periplasmic adaptor subunit [Thioalkalivibrio sulfidiphilus]